MNFEWILSPLTFYIVIALALAACITWFLSMQEELTRLRRAADSSQEALQRKIEAVETVVTDIGQHHPAATGSTAALRPSLNLTRRTQALRMRRRGETVESIAASLAAPRNEIELLLKVYEMVEYRRVLSAPVEPVA